MQSMLSKQQRDAHGNNPLCPPYFKGEGEPLIFKRELAGKTELLRFWKG